MGRSLVQSQYELIQQHERNDYLAHKKKYEQEREFEFINLQRTEAAHKRREDERKRRENQIKQKKVNDIEIQKKLISKVSAKTYLKNLQKLSLKQLLEQGILADKNKLKLSVLIQQDYYPVTESLVLRNNKIDNIIKNELKKDKINKLISIHKGVVNEHREMLEKKRLDKERKIKLEEEAEIQRLKEKAERKENRRINRITKSITDNVINTKQFRALNTNTIPMCDIDELTFKNENIHCIGGQLGQMLMILDIIIKCGVSKGFNENNTNELLMLFLEEYLLKQLKENETFDIRYLESNRFDLKAPPETDDKRKELVDFVLDNRRLMNKSVKLMLEKEMISDNIFKMLMELIANTYLGVNKNPPEPDDTNQEPEYLEMIKKETEDVAAYNEKLEKMKKKINFYFVKPEDLKKKRENVGGFVIVYPDKDIVDEIEEVDEVPVVPGVSESQAQSVIHNNPEDESGVKDVVEGGEVGRVSSAKQSVQQDNKDNKDVKENSVNIENKENKESKESKEENVDTVSVKTGERLNSANQINTENKPEDINVGAVVGEQVEGKLIIL